MILTLSCKKTDHTAERVGIKIHQCVRQMINTTAKFTLIFLFHLFTFKFYFWSLFLHLFSLSHLFLYFFFKKGCKVLYALAYTSLTTSERVNIVKGKRTTEKSGGWNACPQSSAKTRPSPPAHIGAHTLLHPPASQNAEQGGLYSQCRKLVGSSLPRRRKQKQKHVKKIPTKMLVRWLFMSHQHPMCLGLFFCPQVIYVRHPRKMCQANP